MYLRTGCGGREYLVANNSLCTLLCTVTSQQNFDTGKMPVRSAVTRFMMFAERVLKFVGPTEAADDESTVGDTQVSHTATYATGH